MAAANHILADALASAAVDKLPGRKKGDILLFTDKVECPLCISIYSQYWNGALDRTDILIKNVTFGAAQTFPGGFQYEWGGNVDTSPAGLPGQNSPDPLKAFKMHAAVVMPDGTIYDPSYGAKFDNLLDWEEKALAGIVYYKIDSNGESHSYVRKRVTGEELTYYAWF